MGAVLFGVACLRGLMPNTNTAFTNSALRSVSKTVHSNCKLMSGSGKLAGAARLHWRPLMVNNSLSAQRMHTFWTWPRRRELNCHIHAAQVLVRVVRGRFLKEASINQTRLSWTTTKWAMVTASLV